MNAGILALLLVVGVVLAGLAGFVVTLAVRSRGSPTRRRARPAAVPSVSGDRLLSLFMESVTQWFQARVLRLPVLASEHGGHLDNLLTYIHWLMLALFVGWLPISSSCWFASGAPANPVPGTSRCAVISPAIWRVAWR